jgi:hypothetical protein
MNFARMYHLIKAEASSHGRNGKLYTGTGALQSSGVTCSSRAAYKLHPDFKSINFWGGMWFIFGQMRYSLRDMNLTEHSP